MPRKSLYGRLEIQMAAYNRSAATFFLKLAESQPDGEFYSSNASLIFSAFTLEAFLNTLGAKLKLEGEEYERASPDDKLRTIEAKLDFKPNRRSRPYSTLTSLFKFRNAVAHGRHERQNVKQKVDPQWTALQMVTSLETEWERYCRKAIARKAYDDVHQIATDLCYRAGLSAFPGFPFGTPSSGIYRVETK